ncbi:helix-turn-helix domain-containing protein [Streptomyces sp. NPDC059837]|jgi:transcriptional regulator with XRE-family HTH domain|uniref:helix-turn-helix domain-containing protein n=1 Tax=unclassified Streptomyces TaxID=2593676 RepID=UPI00224CE278|nr:MULTISPECIES: helix-turn-helix transcriptional regulator [unclassified Streptomyces]MCX4411130.1 helix-turn-helix domain-containing protein [Streptomyces sp. NBC_01764]MCX4455846.1 helix-turn-helix domain-containing protein [Streptomyces sp. NBC_01719]MCX4495206.1 helix-turn-helix domain-containing protein [Streptomyces sp. NBC_01728]MCX5091934.1 helix-turn-helix domain-containing protein [Streptomyces sp. NBC_00365]MCX5186312.1 helix-turn-helix domain-containing protein [Streptomyces sp. N
MLLGSHLRRLREARGITREAAGYSIRASESKISRMELGRVSFKTRDVEDLLTLYGINDEAERTSLVSLAKEANVAGWWHSYSDVLPSWFPTYVGLEGAAHLIRSYEVQFVHGLLQTEAYAHAVVARGMRGASPADIERRVALRLERQKYLVSEKAPEFHIVLDEAALRRPYGDREVMRGQLQHLIEVSERPNVRLQVMPFSFGGHSGESGSFTILSFPESDLSDVVYLEQLTSALYLDKREDVTQYEGALKQLQQDSPGPSESRDLLRGLLQLS